MLPGCEEGEPGEAHRGPAKLRERLAQPLERGLGRIVVVQDPEPVQEIVLTAVGVAQREQLPVRDVELGAAGVYGAEHGFKHVSLSLLAPIGAGGPAVLANPDRRRWPDPGERQRLLTEAAQQPVHGSVQLVEVKPRSEHVGVHVDSGVVERGREVRSAEVRDERPERAGGGIYLGSDRKPNRCAGTRVPLCRPGSEHAANQRLAGAREGPVGGSGDAGEVGLAGHLQSRKLTAVLGHYTGHEPSPGLDITLRIPVAEDQISGKPAAGKLADLTQRGGGGVGA